jgi:hypothetical protein
MKRAAVESDLAELKLAILRGCNLLALQAWP